jgi:hypothetical protein
MTKQVRLLGCLAALGLFLVLFPGCYTQMASTRGDDDRGEDHGYQSQGQYQDSSYAEQNDRRDTDDYYGYDDQWHNRGYVGFAYYYPPSYCWPSYAFNAAYYDPWAFNFGFSYGYGGGFYTPYPYAYAGYYSPYYPYGYYPNAYYKYSYASNPYHRGVRSFGDTRGVSGGGRGVTTSPNGYVAPPVVNTDRGGYNFPTGARLNPTGTPASHGSTPSTVNPRSTSPQRSASVRGNSKSANGRSGPAVRGWGGRRGVVQTDPRRETPATKPAGRGTQQAAPSTPRSNGGGRESGVQRGNSTPAPRPQAPSTPPSGGGRSGGSGRHDGSGRR